MVSQKSVGTKLNPLRFIETQKKVIYLTFDDGPDGARTEAVLEILKKFNAKATFFLIAEKASAQSALVAKIIADNHAIGNHSLDHKYRNYFTRAPSIQKWIEQAEIIFAQLGINSVGFRSPAGVQTPELHLALDKLNLPLILWNKRFFDTVFEWTPQRAIASLETTTPGSIVLLHDRMSETKLTKFKITLSNYLEAATNRGFEFHCLTQNLCRPKTHKG